MEKQELRRSVWQGLREARAARFPGAAGRIPNFTGAEAAAERLAGADVWQRAEVLKSNPDLPQRPLRHRALKEGKRIYLAVPRLAAERPFLLLDPADLEPSDLWSASSIRGAFELGRPVSLEQMEKVDLSGPGGGAVARDGARLGKGGGYSDLEYALLREAGLATARTPIATTVHPIQVLRRGRIPMARHDISVDLCATPDRLVRCDRGHRRPRGIRWSDLDDARREAIPVLDELAGG